MVLEICVCDNCFKLKGDLTKRYLQIFRDTFQDIFKVQDELIINIEELNAIDRDGVRAITKLHNKAISQKKKLKIIGLDKKTLKTNNDAA